MASQDNTPEKALWALCDLLPLHKTLLFLSTAKNDHYTSVVNYWKRGESFKHKGVSMVNLRALLHSMHILVINEDTGTEKINCERLQQCLAQFGMSCTVGNVRLAKKMYKTIAVEGKINVKADSKRLTRKRTRPLETKWDYGTLCWRHINRSSRPYDQCMDRIRHQNETRRKSLRKTPVTPSIAPRDLRKEMTQAAPPSENIVHSTESDEIKKLKEENARLRSIISTTNMTQPMNQPMRQPMLQPIFQPMLHLAPPDPVNITPIIPPTTTFAVPANVPPMIPPHDVNQKILFAESLDFDNDNDTERIHPVTYFNINVSSRHLPSFYEKELIAINAMQMGYGQYNRNAHHRILKASRSVHFFNG